MTVLDQRQRELVQRQIAVLRDSATAAEVAADAFQAEYDACWKDHDRTDTLVNIERVMQLRAFVPDARANASYDRELADALEILLTGKVPSEGTVGDGHSA